MIDNTQKLTNIINGDDNISNENQDESQNSIMMKPDNQSSIITKSSNIPQVYNEYRNYSNVIKLTQIHSNNNFLAKLHQILSDSTLQDIITWLPHGRSWKILQPEALEKDVISMYFDHCNLISFLRKVARWGFHRVNDGVDKDSYYHELFLRGLPHLCAHMRRSENNKINDLPYPFVAPDFYAISKDHPLPENDNNITNNNLSRRNQDMAISQKDSDHQIIHSISAESVFSTDSLPQGSRSRVHSQISVDISSLTEQQRQELYQDNEIRIRQLEQLLRDRH